MHPSLAHTYSIVAFDPETRQFGVAVQSHYFGVGPVVGWARPGIGAVATQSFVEISYGPLGLELLQAGKTAEQALTGLLAGDQQAEQRQVAMVDARGNVATHTGKRCIAAAGHRQGKNYSVQANLMLKDTVWDAMAEAYEKAEGDLAARMLAALVAAEGEGGDIRGKQSAALLVVSGDAVLPAWGGRIYDLHVDDHPRPLEELARLLAIGRAYAHAQNASDLLAAKSRQDEKFDLAEAEFQLAAREPAMTGNVELVFWYAADLVNAGKVEQALPLFKTVFAADPAWRELVPRLARVGLIVEDAAILERIARIG
jgi:uncharacterized Ntn-hydrolase superfamily protein